MSAVLAALLLQAEGPRPSPFSFLVPMAVIFLIFYVLLIRPQQRRQREHEGMLKSLEKGDRVVTAGGLHGVVTGIADDVLTLEIANLRGERVRVRVDRARIERRVEKGKGEEEK
jgi:preprotein translocase subunit YajC